MHIHINKIEPVARNHFSLEVQLDDAVVVGHITEFEDEDLQGFNFDEEFFDVLFAFDGIGSRFNCEYWAYRNGASEPFPWDYGAHDREIVERAIELSKMDLESLK